eukprot:TRINITY_DN6379_c0_g1_i1.p1 TRINITY_DN6379_c0_g1~~TRINITY_DN6379_c0_g1_i1.p1  ORF type:complete len:120 (-),score=25.66 TRINITY_DN6379_c0_g1_i1:72-431(-)
MADNSPVIEAHRQIFNDFSSMWCQSKAAKLEKCILKNKVPFPTVYAATLNPELSCHCKGKAIDYFDCMDDEIRHHIYKIAEGQCTAQVKACAQLYPGDLSKCQKDPAIQTCGAVAYLKK